jgi:hypothetical protein
MIGMNPERLEGIIASEYCKFDQIPTLPLIKVRLDCPVENSGIFAAAILAQCLIPVIDLLALSLRRFLLEFDKDYMKKNRWGSKYSFSRVDTYHRLLLSRLLY